MLIRVLILIWSFLFDSLLASPLSNGPWGPTDPVADALATIVTDRGTVRITVLTDQVLRVERASREGAFEDRKTIAFINRKLPVPDYTVDIISPNNTFNLQTKCLSLSYRMGASFSSDTFHVEGRMYCNSNLAYATNSKWTYQYGQQDPRNLLGTIRTLDMEDVTPLNCTLRDPLQDHCEWGLISRSGFSIVNDTLNYALDDERDWWDGPNVDLEDFYVFGHGHEYKAALSDFRLLGGAIPLLPKYALGVWFSRWYDYTSSSAADVVRQFEMHSLPLDVFVLDMNWHTKNDWTGYSWDKRLFGHVAEDRVSYLKHRGLAVTMNLHDANGVNPWEDEYQELAKFLNHDRGDPILFSIVNETLAYALEDMVLRPLEDQSGIDFWWIDWQQGESGPGGSEGGKHNPTIWTSHIRSTNANRRNEGSQQSTKRDMVLARWGGLGGHRYPVHFSGDVAHLSWQNLKFQVYFSMVSIYVPQ